MANAGLTVEKVPETSELGGVFYGFASDMVEYEIRRGGYTMRLQLSRFDRRHSPVIMGIGPVLHIDDAMATKVAALATRAYERDFIDVAAALDRYTRQQLVELARAADPGLTDEDFADAMCRLDRLSDEVFSEQYGWTADQVARLRARFADWPRS